MRFALLLESDMDEPRFVTKWVNGIWTIFDRVRFTNVEPDLGTKKNADKLLAAPPKPQPARKRN